jgi:hypothetical protein
VPPGATELARIPDVLAWNCRFRPQGSGKGLCVGCCDRRVSKSFPLFDIVEKEREAQAACVLAVRMGNHLDNETSVVCVLRDNQNSFGGNIETTWFLVNVRNAINSGR